MGRLSPDRAAQRSARARSRARKRRRLDADFDRFAQSAGPRWKSFLLALCFFVPGLLAVAYTLNEAGAMFGALKMADPIIDTTSSTFGMVFVALCLIGLGVLGLLGAAHQRWAFYHADKFFAGIVVFLMVGIGLMMAGSSINAMLLRDHGYVACDRKSYTRMTTTLWASQERGCEGVTYSILNPL